MTLAKPTTSFAMAERAKIRKDWLPKAIQTIAACMDSPNEQIKLAAASKILEHAIGKAPQSEALDGAVQGTAQDALRFWLDLVKSGAIKLDAQKVYEVIRVKDEPLVLGGEDDSERGEDRES